MPGNLFVSRARQSVPVRRANAITPLSVRGNRQPFAYYSLQIPAKQTTQTHSGIGIHGQGALLI